MNGRDGVQKLQVANALLTLRVRQADVLRLDPLQRQLIADNQKSCDRTAHEAGGK